VTEDEQWKKDWFFVIKCRDRGQPTSWYRFAPSLYSGQVVSYFEKAKNSLSLWGKTQFAKPRQLRTGSKPTPAVWGSQTSGGKPLKRFNRPKPSAGSL